MITIVVTMLFLSIANIFTLLFKRNKRLSCLYLLGYRSVDSDQRMARYHWWIRVGRYLYSLAVKRTKRKKPVKLVRGSCL